jgi:hypothetical protein
MSLASSSIGGRGLEGCWKAAAIVYFCGQDRLRDLHRELRNIGSICPAVLPQLHGYWQRVDVDPFPPPLLVAGSVRSANVKNLNHC